MCSFYVHVDNKHGATLFYSDNNTVREAEKYFVKKENI